MSEPYPYNEYQEAWLRDLETTDAPQTRGWLHRITEGNLSGEFIGFCCLGRACVVMGMDGQACAEEGIVAYGDGETTLPTHLADKLLLTDSQGTLKQSIRHRDGHIGALTEMNDEGWSFREIAAYVRENPWNVFLDPAEPEAPDGENDE